MTQKKKIVSKPRSKPWVTNHPLAQHEDALGTVMESLDKGDLALFQKLNVEERQFVLQLVESLDKGDSAVLDALYSVDYESIPVEPDIFFTEPDYMGHMGKDLYPAWWGHLLKCADPANGIYEVILTGAIGIGKCARYDTLIPTSRGVLTAQEVFESKPKEVEAESGLRKLANRFDEGVIPTVKMTTIRGHEFEGSPHHRLRVLNGWKREWKELQHLQPGDVVVVQPANYLDGKEMALEAAELAGWYIAEGNMISNGAILSLNPQDVQYVYDLAIKAMPFLPYKSVSRSDIRDIVRLKGGKETAAALKVLWGPGTSHFKDIPVCIRQGNEEVICAFLKGLYSGDGTCTGNPSLSTMSRTLAFQVGTLLTYLGIYSTIRNRRAVLNGVDYGISYNVNIVGSSSLAAFAAKINFVPMHKNAGLNDCLPITSNSDHFYGLPMDKKAANELRAMQPTERCGPGKKSKYGDKKHSPKGLLSRIVAGQRVTTPLLNEVLNAGGKLPSELFKLATGITMFDVVESAEKSSAHCYDFTVDRDPSYISNGFVSHNTFVAMLLMAYKIYRISKLRDPAHFFGLASKSQIVFGVYSLTLANAEEVGFHKLRHQLMSDSPYFKEMFPHKPGGTDTIEWPQKHLKVITGSNALHVLGKDLLGIVVDEINFMAKGRGTAPKAHELASAVSRRLESRFMTGMGVRDIPGVCIYVSSKKAETSYLEQRIAKVHGLPGVHIVDGPAWDFLAGKIKYCGKSFRLLLGDATHDPMLLDNVKLQVDGNIIIESTLTQFEEARLDGKIIDVPIEHYKAFAADPLGSIRDVGGIASSAITNFFPRKNVIQEMFDTGDQLPQYFHTETQVMPIRSSVKLTNLFDLNLACAVSLSRRHPYRHPHAPRYIHVDLARNKDAVGIVMLHPSEFTIHKGAETQGTVEESVEKFYEVDFVTRITTDTRGEDIDFNKIEEFIIWLKKNGFWIRRVTYDGYQSAGSIQALRTFGIDAGVRSVDKTVLPYRILSSVVHARKISCPPHAFLQKEMGALVYKSENDKIDHPDHYTDGTRGSKDCADALAGAVYECTIDKLTPADSPPVSDRDTVSRYDEYLVDAKNIRKELGM